MFGQHVPGVLAVEGRSLIGLGRCFGELDRHADAPGDAEPGMGDIDDHLAGDGVEVLVHVRDVEYGTGRQAHRTGS